MVYDLQEIVNQIGEIYDCGWEDGASDVLMEYSLEDIRKILKDVRKNKDIPEHIRDQIITESGLVIRIKKNQLNAEKIN